MYREEYLNKAVDALRPRFRAAGAKLPKKIRVSVGWPGGRGPKRNVVGQCWPASTTTDRTVALFVSPTISDPVEVLITLTHELCHAAGKHGHRKDFSTLAKAVGLVAPWTHTPASPELKADLRQLAKDLGKFDHGKIKPSSIIKQTTRLLKVACPSCGYTARITQKWIDTGLPVCPDGTEMETA